MKFITLALLVGTISLDRTCETNRKCVPYYFCNNEEVSKHGADVIDIRFGSSSPCNLLETCCKTEDIVDKPQITPEPTPKGCGYRNQKGIGFKITGASDNESEYGEFPWMVAILEKQMGKGFVFHCGGSLILPNVVLTAAHCVLDSEPSALKARAGEWDMKSNAEFYPHQDRKVSEIIVHENHYRKGLHNDVALLIFNKPFELADNVKTVCLPPSDTEFDFNTCYATGWGKSKFEKEASYHKILKKIDLEVVPQTQCRNKLQATRLGGKFELHDSFLCAGGVPGKDTCKGDGGSPLVCPIPGSKGRYYQAGIVAWGIGCGGDVPGVYASIPKMRSWIDEQLASKKIDSTDFTP